MPRTLLYLVTEDWYFATHRLGLARAAREAGYRVVVATRVKGHGEALRAAGCLIEPLAWRRSGNGLWSHLRALAEVTRLYRRVRPDLVHHVALKPVVFGSLAARLARVPGRVNAVAGLGYAFTATDAKARTLRMLLTVTLRALLGGRGTRVIVQNRDDRDFLISRGIVKASDVVLIRGAGVDLDRFRPTPPVEDRPLVVLPARMLWDKGVGAFVQASRALRGSGVEARFALVGEPDPDNPHSVPREQLEQWAAEGVVEWWGHRVDMPEVFRQCHVVCLPTSYGEGIPKALIEAAACARPIVATDAPGCREIVRQGENGLLVPIGDGSALAAGLRRLLDDAALRQAMGARGRRLVEDEFSVGQVIAETLAVYRSLAS